MLHLPARTVCYVTQCSNPYRFSMAVACVIRCRNTIIKTPKICTNAADSSNQERGICFICTRRPIAHHQATHQRVNWCSYHKAYQQTINRFFGDWCRQIHCTAAAAAHDVDRLSVKHHRSIHTALSGPRVSASRFCHSLSSRRCRKADHRSMVDTCTSKSEQWDILCAFIIFLYAAPA